MIVALKAQLVPQLTPKYVVLADRHVYLERESEELSRVLRPDIYVSEPGSGPEGTSDYETSDATVATIEPEIYRVPMPIEQRESYLTIRDKESRQVVTIIEFLSPANKRRGSDGHEQYQERRSKALSSAAHLVEIDLLRAGARPATTRKLRSSTDYCAMVHRVSLRPKVQVYQWPLRHTLPEIPVPVCDGDPDARLDLQQAFQSAYDSGAYQYHLPYREPLQPPLRESDRDWVSSILAQLPAKQRPTA